MSELIPFARLGNGVTTHAIESMTVYDGGKEAGRAKCGIAGYLGEVSEADDRAIRVAGDSVCRNCRDVLDNDRRDGSVALTPTRATSPEGGTMTTAAPEKTRTKAPSAALLDPAKYATTSAARLRQERATLSNRLSGVNTQIKRSDDAKKTKELERRKADLLKRRDKVNKALAAKSNDLAEATQAQAAGRKERPSEAAMRELDEQEAAAKKVEEPAEDKAVAGPAEAKKEGKTKKK